MSNSVFQNYKESDSLKREIIRWNPDESPKTLTGFFQGIETIKMSDGTSFDIIRFKNCCHYPSNATIGDIDFRAYAMLKRKCSNYEIGTKLGIEYLGKSPDKNNPTKTIHGFSVYNMNDVIGNDIPF